MILCANSLKLLNKGVFLNHLKSIVDQLALDQLNSIFSCFIIKTKNIL